MDEFDFNKREFQVMLLNGCVTNLKILDACAEFAGKGQFSDTYLYWVFDKAKSLYQDNGKLPSKKDFGKALAAKKEDKKYDEYLSALKDVYSCNNAVSDLKLIENYITHTRVVTGIQEYEDAVKRGDFDTAKKTIDSVETFDMMSNGAEWDGCDYSAQMASRLQYWRDVRDGKIIVPQFITGWQEFDKQCFAYRGHLNMVMGATGTGKTTWLLNLAYRYAHKYKVLYIPLEMTSKELCDRIDALSYNISMAKLKNFNFDEEQISLLNDRIQYTKGVIGGRLRVESLPPGEANFARLNKRYGQLVEEGFEPDIVIIDSLDHMEERANNRIEKHSISYLKGKGFALKNNVCLWTSTHANKSVAKKRADTEDASDSYDKSRLSDTVITLNMPQPKEQDLSNNEDFGEVEENLDEIMCGQFEDLGQDAYSGDDDWKDRELWYAKNRHGKDKFSIDIQISYETMKVREVQ